MQCCVAGVTLTEPPPCTRKDKGRGRAGGSNGASRVLMIPQVRGKVMQVESSQELSKGVIIGGLLAM